eukprot:TRINITY_DN11218_c0_g1_i2.p3 TRINITY_DN11218_c0_g1~~TRINITY_DN11218_c0_g1_i2.p3  ORF type:complete len:111 (+),score=17.13 TRINITY_DN11218_c0_g1_i2:170-502(+)
MCIRDSNAEYGEGSASILKAEHGLHGGMSWNPLDWLRRKQIEATQNQIAPAGRTTIPPTRAADRFRVTRPARRAKDPASESIVTVYTGPRVVPATLVEQEPGEAAQCMHH